MDINVYIIRVNGENLLKTIRNISSEKKEIVIEKLRIQNKISPLEYDCVWCAKELKQKAQLLYDECKYPPFQGLLDKINILNDDEYVTIFSFIPDNRFLEKCRIACEVKRIGGSPCEAWYPDLHEEKTGRYAVFAFLYHGHHHFIGEPDKNKRTCRFCNKTGANLFKKDSHAISAFIGNDYLFCNEECDECNENFFSTTMEHDLDNYFKIARSLSRSLNRKKKKINVKGENYYIDNSGEYPKLTYYAKEDEVIDLDNISEDGLNFYLLNNAPVKLCNIYKLFVKYAIAVIPNEHLPQFKRAIYWIRGKLESKSLPPIYRCDIPTEIDKPEIAVFIRKDEMKDIPFCIVRFAFMSYYYIFAIPFCQPYDEDNYLLGKALERYLQLCGEQKSIYKVEDYNSSEAISYYTKITIFKDSKLVVHIEKPNTDVEDNK